MLAVKLFAMLYEIEDIVKPAIQDSGVFEHTIGYARLLLSLSCFSPFAAMEEFCFCAFAYLIPPQNILLFRCTASAQQDDFAAFQSTPASEPTSLSFDPFASLSSSSAPSTASTNNDLMSSNLLSHTSGPTFGAPMVPQATPNVASNQSPFFMQNTPNNSGVITSVPNMMTPATPAQQPIASIGASE